MQREVSNHQDVAVIIPAYNEVATIRVVVITVLAQVGQVIVVDDDSTDGTGSAVADLPITLLQNKTNLGKASSLMKGFTEALNLGYKKIISFDADGQHDASDLPKMMRAAEKHPDKIIIGARLKNCENAPRSRYYANRIADFFISWACGYRIYDTQSGFRLYPAALLKQSVIPHSKKHCFAFESHILIEAALLGFQSAAIAISSHYSNQQRPSYFRPGRDIYRIFKVVAKYLVKSGMNPKGLWRYFRGPFSVIETDD